MICACLAVTHTLGAENISLSILPMDAFIASALVHQRVIPCSPMTPTTGITVQVVEFYCVARQCNPHFSIQAYVKTMCDLQGVSVTKPYTGFMC
jgi:hypothetical protein